MPTSGPILPLSRASRLSLWLIPASAWASATLAADHHRLPRSFENTAAQTHAQNHPECTCRAQGQSFPLGSQICLSGMQGSQIFRCSMDLNVTSWKSVGTPCPQS
jgi:hypothetical protein